MIDWRAEKKPILALSPMADLTDSAFCRLAKRWGARIVFREMVSAEAVARGNEKTLGMTAFDETERPIVQQIFGSDPATMAEAAHVIYERYRPDALDLNMGCPVYKLVSNFNGAALMKDPKLAAEIVRQVKVATPLPVSVKIRLGWSDPNDCLTFAPVLEEAGADLITVHGRTKVQGYSGTADWRQVGEVKKLVKIPVLVNGDVHKPEDAPEALKQSGCDGVMVARGALGNPWIFQQMAEVLAAGVVETQIDWATRVQTVLDHAKLMIEAHGERGIVLMRKHYPWYFKATPGAALLRARLMTVTTLLELEETLRLI
jgi:nifR3 family TIM-barrel protein